ncbi:DUF2786 domain-containing protein [Streptomyces sp. NBC_01578]|uniref:DUF2786 domain-containing protein n=1 Tax=Streptomyces sp. NBC_01578 TaxID=2975884 RepID=UPI0038686A12
MSPPSTPIARRIQALLTLAEHPGTPGPERELAATRAAALMKRYGTDHPARRDGIIVVRMEPDKTLEVLVLSADPEQATRQIADNMGRPGGLPASCNLRYLDPRNLNPGIVVWRDVASADEGRPVNFMASNITNRGGGLGGFGSIRGTAVVSGYDTATGAITSTPLETLEHLLSMEAYRDAAEHLHAWRTEHDVSTRPKGIRPRPTVLRVLSVQEVAELTPCELWEARLQVEIWIQGEWVDLIDYEGIHAVCHKHRRACRTCPAGTTLWDWRPPPTLDGILAHLSAHDLTGGLPHSALSVEPGAYSSGDPAASRSFHGLKVLTVPEVCELTGCRPWDAHVRSQVWYSESRVPRMTTDHVGHAAACSLHGPTCRVCAARDWEWTSLPMVDTLREIFRAYFSSGPAIPPSSVHVAPGTYPAGSINEGIQA